MLDDLHQLKQRMQSEGAIFCFSGPVSHAVVLGIGDALKENMQTGNVDTSTSMKVFAIFVEQMQNIINYSTERVHAENSTIDLGFGVIVVGRKEEEFFVLCGNRIAQEKVEKLRGYLTELVTLDKEALKQLYREKRKKGPDEDSKGAGLGFIEMARKSRRPLEFEFQDVSDREAFFTVKTYI